MNGRAFTETQKTVGIDGREVTDADVAQVVQRKRKEAEEPSIRSRLNKLSANLRGMQEAYDLALHTWANAGAPLRSPNYDQRRSGKPTSRIPSEAEARTRVFLVLAAQRIAMALRVLAKHGWLSSDAWHPASLQRVDDKGPVFTGRGDPLWRDPDGDVTVEPPDVTRGVSQIRGAVTTLHTKDDEDAVLDFLHEAEEAVNFVNKTGAWFRGLPAQETKLCSRQGCWNEPKDGLVCRACVQKDYRERKKAS